MKVCEDCGLEIDGGDADTRCQACELIEDSAALEKRQAQRQARRVRAQVMRDLGLVRVRGNLGGTYWE